MATQKVQFRLEYFNRMTDHIKEENEDKRPSWDDYFMEVANAISKRATCDRGRVAALSQRTGSS